MLTTPGVHDPVIPLVELVGNVGADAPAQMDKLVPKLNAGVILGLTVRSNVVIVAHCPAAGVNVYVPELWLSITPGLHVPVIPFVDVFVSVGTFPPAQIVELVPKPKDGVMFGLTVTTNVADVAQGPGSGVNV